MRRRSVSGVILLALLGLAPTALAGQDTRGDASPRVRDAGFELQQNYPNPFNSTTRIPFVLNPSLFEDGRPVIVTMRIFNVLQQFVAYPTALNHPDGNGVVLDGLEYHSSGPMEAFWNGQDINGRQVSSGLYHVQLIVKGERQVMRMMVAR